jgi:hypothetical protein
MLIIFWTSSALPLRLSASLCVSAVEHDKGTFTAETQRNAEKTQKKQGLRDTTGQTATDVDFSVSKKA